MHPVLPGQPWEGVEGWSTWHLSPWIYQLFLLHNSPHQSREGLKEDEGNILREDVHVGSWWLSLPPATQSQFPSLLAIVSHPFWKVFLIPHMSFHLNSQYPLSLPLPMSFLELCCFSPEDISHMPSERSRCWYSVFRRTVWDQKRIDLFFHPFLLSSLMSLQETSGKCLPTSPYPHSPIHIYTVSKNKS